MVICGEGKNKAQNDVMMLQKNSISLEWVITFVAGSCNENDDTYVDGFVIVYFLVVCLFPYPFYKFKTLFP